MTSREFENVQGREKEILNRHLSEFPIKLGQLAKDLGVTVKIAHMNTAISGQIKKEKEGYIVRINRYEARERQRFTIAHELAHFFLHKERIERAPDGLRDSVLYRSGGAEPEYIEFEANRLAADIVMPITHVKKILEDDFGGNITDEVIESLATRFEVSKAAMELRLSALSES